MRVIYTTCDLWINHPVNLHRKSIFFFLPIYVCTFILLYYFSLFICHLNFQQKKSEANVYPQKEMLRKNTKKIIIKLGKMKIYSIFNNNSGSTTDIIIEMKRKRANSTIPIQYTYKTILQPKMLLYCMYLLVHCSTCMLLLLMCFIKQICNNHKIFNNLIIVMKAYFLFFFFISFWSNQN